MEPAGRGPTNAKRGGARLRRQFMWKTCGFLVDKLYFLVENSENVEKVGGKCGKLAQKDQKMWITCGKVVDNS